MTKQKTISVFEHQRLYVGEHSFKQSHLDALLRLNEYHDGNYFEIKAEKYGRKMAKEFLKKR